MKGAAYGKCIFADYNNVYKDKCAKEFMALKDCYLVLVLRHLHFTALLIDDQAAAKKGK